MLLKTHSLPPDISSIVCNKGTEQPFTGRHDQLDIQGSYLCRQCGLALFRSQSKFNSGCGWPSFDKEVAGAVKQTVDADGKRSEILCARCDAHLGHVFKGENFTPQDTRHCVNSRSLDFVTDAAVMDTEEAILAAGCFWGVEYCLQRVPGVIKTETGYIGGSKSYPTYNEVCTGKTGHMEAVRVVYDVTKTNYATLLHYFFKIHDPSQADGQGPDIGSQYLSGIFCHNEVQKDMAQKIMAEFQTPGKLLATRILPASIFWPAEEYHQDYYTKTGKQPYCHRPV